MAAQKSVKHKLTRRKVVSQRKRPQYFVRWIFLVGILVLLLWGASRLFGSWQNRVWRSSARITFVVSERDPIVYSFQPGGKLLFFKIPRDTQIETAGEYGTFPAGSLWELDQQKGKGGELLRLSIQRSLGIPVDAWIGKGGGEFVSPHPLSRIAIFKESTNLTFFDRLAILLSVSSVNSADKKNLDLETSRVLRKEEFPDGASGFVIVPEQAKIFFEALRDESVAHEGKTLTVVNTTPQRGLAGKVADVAGALGIRVVATQTRVVAVETEGEGKDDTCVIKGKKEDLGSLSARRLSQVFQCKRREGETREAASLEIILGRDFVNIF